MSIKEKLLAIQTSLVAPKGQYNSFGKYKYRSLEDITTAVKPLLKDNGCTLVISDKMVEVGGRVYVQATATLSYEDGNESATGYAREPESQKGMNEAQITGSASSYARKYACNGLFAIDDTKDADATNDHGKGPTPDKQAKFATAEEYNALSNAMQNCTNQATLDKWIAANLPKINKLSDKDRKRLQDSKGNMIDIFKKETA